MSEMERNDDNPHREIKFQNYLGVNTFALTNFKITCNKLFNLPELVCNAASTKNFRIALSLNSEVSGVKIDTFYQKQKIVMFVHLVSEANKKVVLPKS